MTRAWNRIAVLAIGMISAWATVAQTQDNPFAPTNSAPGGNPFATRASQPKATPAQSAPARTAQAAPTPAKAAPVAANTSRNSAPILEAKGSNGPSQAEQVASEPEAGTKTVSLFELVVSSKWPMYAIIFCSLVLVAVSLERFFALRASRIIPRPFVKRFLHQLRNGDLDNQEALAVCLDNNSCVADVFAHAVRKWGRPGVEVEQAIIDGGERNVTKMRRYLRVINGVATIAPLFGLLGTVLGMIAAFENVYVGESVGDPTMLANGIRDALMTTAGGLIVAIPAIVAYMYFISKVDKLTVEIDSLGQELVHIVSAEALSTTGDHYSGKAHEPGRHATAA